MERLDCFIDEPGWDDMSSDVYLITLVFHKHSETLDEAISAYEARLSGRGLLDIPFHMVDLLHGRGDYKLFDPAQGKPMLYAFATFVRTLPITYATLRFNANTAGSRCGLEAQIRKSVQNLRTILRHPQQPETQPPQTRSQVQRELIAAICKRANGRTPIRMRQLKVTLTLCASALSIRAA